MMKKLILTVLISVLLLSVTTIVTNVPAANAFELPDACAYALWHPGYAATCVAMILFELWNPLDWDD
ncbi:MAG: hypothetical protein MUO58_19580 [Anaerolineales bacterium]|nr:hypothetical protein [Anaerolineales bacterium]